MARIVECVPNFSEGQRKEVCFSLFLMDRSVFNQW
jgi:glutamate formiminotransferase